MNDFLLSDLKRLREITRGCRDDMHEPDEQGVEATLGPSFRKGYGNYILRIPLDNASPDENGDLGFWLVRNNGGGNESIEWFNLADVIALARTAPSPDLGTLLKACHEAADTLKLCKGEVPEMRETMRANAEAFLRQSLKYVEEAMK